MFYNPRNLLSLPICGRRHGRRPSRPQTLPILKTASVYIAALRLTWADNTNIGRAIQARELRDGTSDENIGSTVDHHLRQAAAGGQEAALAIVVTHREHNTKQVVMLFDNGAMRCTCNMPTNLGIPCRHFFAAHAAFAEVRFDVNFIAKR